MLNSFCDPKNGRFQGVYAQNKWGKQQQNLALKSLEKQRSTGGTDNCDKREIINDYLRPVEQQNTFKKMKTVQTNTSKIRLEYDR